MASRYAIESVFRLIDQVSAPTSKIGRALDSMGIKSKTVSNALKRDFDKASARADRLGASIAKLGKYAVVGALGAIGAGIGIATKQFIEFDSAVTAASAKFKDIDVTSSNYRQTLDAIAKKARDVAAVTEYNAVDTAGALDKMAMAGLTSEQAMSLLMGTTNLATAAGMDLTTAVDIATDALGAFGLMSSDTDILSGNLDRLSDVMARTTNMFNTDMSMMFEAIKKGGPTFTAAGQSVEDFSALVGVLASSGIKGSDAGTSLRNMMLSLANPSKAAADELQKLHIATRDTNGNYLNAIDILEQFERQTQNMGSAEKSAALTTIFGNRTVTAMNILLAEGSERLRGYRGELENATGAAENIANAMRGSLKNRLAVLGSALTELGFKFVEAFKDKGGDAIAKLTEAVSNFDITPIVGMVQAAAAAIGRFASFLMGAVKVAWQFRYVIIAVLAPIALYNAALMGITIAFRAYQKIQGIVTAAKFFFTLATQGQTAALAGLTAGTVVHAIAEKGLAIATGIATAAQWAFNVALTANPIGIIIVAIGALIAAIVLLVKNWDKVTAAIKNNVNKVMAVLSILFGPIGFIISMIKEVAANFGRIKDALGATGLFDKIKEIGTAIKNFIQPAIDWLIGVWETVKNTVAGFIESIKSFFAPLVNWIVGAWNKATSVIGGFFKGIFDAVASFVQPALNWLAEKWQQIVASFQDNAIINAIKVIGGTLVSGLLAPIQGLLEILSYIPGLGHLAGKGAEKIQEFRNFLTGKAGESVTVDASLPESVEAELTPPTANGAGAIPEMAEWDYSNGGGASGGGRSKLHGVVDISGGDIADMSGADTIRTATSGASGATGGGASSVETITRTVIDVASILRRIDNSVSTIARNTPAITVPETSTRTSLAAPRIGGENESAEDYRNPREVAPVTQAERAAYSYSERMERLVIEVAAERGTAARIVRAPRDAEIQLVNSGGNA
jgi:TP901 family phage tail tape measure protein